MTVHQNYMPAQTYSKQAIAEIYDANYLPIYRFVYRRVGDVDTARDLTADVFRKLLEGLRLSAPVENIPAWLYRTAHNTVVDFYRKQKFRRHASLADDVSDGKNPMAQAEQRIDAEAVKMAMTHLTTEQQTVISLKFLQGLSNMEVAEILEKPVGAVKSLQFRALAALRRQLDRSTEEV